MLNLLTRLVVLVLAEQRWAKLKLRTRGGKGAKKNSRRGTYAFVTTGTVCHRRTVSVPLFAKTDSATLSDKAHRLLIGDRFSRSFATDENVTLAASRPTERTIRREK